MKTYPLKLYEHPLLDYTAWSKTPDFLVTGLHIIKDGAGYVKLPNAPAFFLDVAAATHLAGEFTDQAPTKTAPAPSQGISEDTLLAALAIAQDSSLAVNILALRKS